MNREVSSMVVASNTRYNLDPNSNRAAASLIRLYISFPA